MCIKVLLAEMSWTEVRDRVKQTDVAIVPIGSLEQHGPHLPLKTDLFIAEEIAKRTAERVKDDVKAIVTPSLPFGYSPMMAGFPGTIGLQSTTLMSIVKDVCSCLLQHGFRKIVFFNGHGGNPQIVLTALFDTYYNYNDPNIFLVLVNWDDLAVDAMDEVLEERPWHAEEMETSVVMALGVPVDLKLASEERPNPPMPKYVTYDMHPPEPCHRWISYVHPRFKDISKSGVVGDPTKANRDKGERIVKVAVDRFAEILKEIKSAKTWLP